MVGVCCWRIGNSDCWLKNKVKPALQGSSLPVGAGKAFNKGEVMPGKKICNKISDPVERAKCLKYQGKYADKGPVKNNPSPPKTIGY